MAPTGTSGLSLPLRHVSGTRQPIRDVRLDNSQPFRYRHLKILRSSYASTPYFDEVYPIVEQAYARDHDYLAGLNLDLIGRALRLPRRAGADRAGQPGA